MVLEWSRFGGGLNDCVFLTKISKFEFCSDRDQVDAAIKTHVERVSSPDTAVIVRAYFTTDDPICF